MKRVSQTKQFHRDVKRMRKRVKDLSKLQALVRRLADGSPLYPQHRDHPLLGAWAPTRDCHVEPDWILIYTPGIDNLVLDVCAACSGAKERAASLGLIATMRGKKKCNHETSIRPRI